jgi:hypothetical protein
MPDAKLQYLKLIIGELEQEVRELKERLAAAEHAALTSFNFIKETED